MLQHADRKPERVVDRRHPLRIALGEVIVDRDQVSAVAFERVQIQRQRRDERLALARAHLGDLALVQDDAADDLDVVVAHLHLPLGGFADDGEGLGQDVVERGAVFESRDELRRLGGELIVGEALDIALPVGDRIDRAGESLDLARVGVSEQGACPLLGPVQQTHPATPNSRPNAGHTPSV